MPSELVQLVVEIDASKVGPATARMRQDFATNVRAMDADSTRAARSVESVGDRGLTAGKLAVTGMKAASAAIGAATAAVAAQERSWISLGTTILASYAAGGPVGAAIATLGAGIGLLVSEQKRAAESAREWADEVRRVNEGIRESLVEERDTLADRLAELRAADASELERATTEYDRARQTFRRLADTRDAAGVRLGDMTSADQIDSESYDQAANLRLVFDQLATVRELLPKLDLEVRRAAVGQALRLVQEEGQAVAQIASMRAELEGRATNEVAIEQRILQLGRERAIVGRDTTARGQEQAATLDRQIEAQRALLGATIETNRARADRDLSRELETLRAVTDAERERLAIVRDVEERRRAGASEALLVEYATLRAMQPTIEFARQLSDTVRGGLTDAIVDGLTNGFRNGGDIARALFDQLLRQSVTGVAAAATSALPSLFVGLLGGGGGGGGVGGIFGALAGAFGGGGGSAGGGLGGIIGGGLGGGAAPLPDT